MRALLMLLALGGCRLEVKYPGSPYTDPDADRDTDPPTDSAEPDSDPPSDTGDTDPLFETDVPCDRGAWWSGADLDGDGSIDLPHRVLLAVTGPGVPTQPLSFDVDFAARLSRAGAAGNLAPDSVRVVLQGCDSRVLQRSQFDDSLRNLLLPADHLDPVGDQHGAVTWLFDADGDDLTAEPLPSGTTWFGIYYSTAATGQVPASTELSLTVDGALHTFNNGLTSAVLDADRGGMLTTFSMPGQPSVMSQATSCCGNSMHFWAPTTQPGPPWGWVTPQSTAATTEVITTGPVLSAVRSTGERFAILSDTEGTVYGSYRFELWFWLFDRRPELVHELTHTATSDCTTEHDIEASFGFRPLQATHTLADEVTPTWVADQDGPYLAVYTDDAGLAIAMTEPPAEFARVSNPVGSLIGGPISASLFAFHGNEVVPTGELSPATIPSGTPFFDHVRFALIPFDGDWASIQSEVVGLLESPRIEEVLP